MTKKLLFVVSILLVVAFAAMAADVTGKWTFEQAGRGGGNPTTVTLTLKADGANLTGTVTRGGGGGGGGQAPAPGQVSKGKVDGANFSFEVSQDMGGMTMVTKYEGSVSGGDMKLKITRTGQDGTPTATDVVAKKSTT